MIDLPQLVVVGSQSSGKSSVLESIVGRDFLPRNSGICTRRPLVLQLHQLSEKLDNEQIKKEQPFILQDSDQLYQNTSETRKYANYPKQLYHRKKELEDFAEFNHKPGQHFTNFAEVREEIVQVTNKVAGINKGISSEPIILKIFSKEVVNLTMVDLPGIVKVPAGDQPHDIEYRVKELIMKFITNPHSIILAVTAANTDLANSDALKLAKEVDPKGERTLGVITKIDLMDSGTDAVEVLQGKVFPLRLGYVGVICRSQKDILNHKPISEALKSEAEYFSKHPKYIALRNRLGVPFLASKMNRTLITHIKSSLPHLRSNVSTMLTQRQKQYQSFGLDFNSENQHETGALILNLISKFCSYYTNMIEGKFVRESSSEYKGGSRINYIFHDIFTRTINNMDPFDSLRDDDIRTAIKNANGLRPNLFVPQGAFEILVRQQIARLLQPASQCVDMVYGQLRKIVATSNVTQLNRFSPLRDTIVGIMEDLLKKCLSPTNQMIRSLIEIEDAYINTSHPDFMGGANAMMSLFSKEAMQQRGQGDIFKQQKPIYSLYKDDPQLNFQQQSQQQQQHQQQQQQFGEQRIPLQHSEHNNDDKDFGFHNLSHGDAARKGSQDQSGGNEGKATKSSWFPFFSGNNSGNKKAKQQSESVQNQRQQQQQRELDEQKMPDDAAMMREQILYDGDSSSLQSTTKGYYNQIRKNRPYDQYYIDKDFDMNNLPVVLPKIQDYMRAGREPNMREKMETNIIKNLITSYFDVVRKNISDSIPKTIMAFLVNQSKSLAQRELVTQLYNKDGENIKELLQESPEVKFEREECKKQLNMLKDAMEVISELRDYAVTEVKLKEPGIWEGTKRK